MPPEKRWQSGYEPYKRRFSTKIHLAVDLYGMPVRILITEGTRADCKDAVHLIEGITAENLVADRGYDTSSKRALFKKFCKRDFCDEVRDFKIPDQEAVAS